jgi:hypothetical protein
VKGFDDKQLTKELGVDKSAIEKIAAGFRMISDGLIEAMGETSPTTGMNSVPAKPKQVVKKVDYELLREECKTILLDVLKDKGRDVVLGILKPFGAEALKQVKDEQLVEFKEALEKAKSLTPASVD